MASYDDAEAARAGSSSSLFTQGFLSSSSSSSFEDSYSSSSASAATHERHDVVEQDIERLDADDATSLDQGGQATVLDAVIVPVNHSRVQQQLDDASPTRSAPVPEQTDGTVQQDAEQMEEGSAMGQSQESSSPILAVVERAPEERDDDFSPTVCATRRRRWALPTILLAVVASAVGVTVGVLNMNKDANETPTSVEEPPPEDSVDPTADGYLQEIRTILVPPYLWTDTNAPQLRATEFMAYGDTDRVNVTSPRLYQRYALLVMYFANGGERWPIQPSSHECQWSIVECNDEEVVMKLLMGSQLDMTGFLPSEVALLRQLEHLDLQQNRLEGTLPDTLYGLTNLTHFALNGNRFASTISDDIGLFTSLKTFNVQDNFFEGTLPESLGLLTHLKIFRASNNFFEGPVLHHLLSWPKLVEFAITNTFLTGTLPTEIGLLTDLYYFQSLRARVGGTLPSEIGNLSMLRTFVLADSYVNGTIPATLGNLSSLKHLLLSINFLTSTIPSELGQLTLIETLAMAWNALNGTLPTQFGLFPGIKDLYLNQNKLTGQVPSELGQLTTLARLQIHRSGMTGVIPSELCVLREFDLGQFMVDCEDQICDIPECCTECIAKSQDYN